MEVSDTEHIGGGKDRRGQRRGRGRATSVFHLVARVSGGDVMARFVGGRAGFITLFSQFDWKAEVVALLSRHLQPRHRGLNEMKRGP